MIDTGESSPPDVTVRITDVYTPPSTFDREPPYYRAGTLLTLICNSNIVGRAFYHWTSNCSMNCFVKDKLNKNVSSDFLRSTDSGVHTCTVDGNNEGRGSGSITVHVVGKLELVNYKVKTYCQLPLISNRCKSNNWSA